MQAVRQREPNSKTSVVPHGELSADQARKLAAVSIRRIKVGKDPIETDRDPAPEPTVGYGVRDLSLTPARAEAPIETGLSNVLAAFGGRTKLTALSGGAGRFELALRSDARFTATASDTAVNLLGATGASFVPVNSVNSQSVSGIAVRTGFSCW